MIKIANPIYDGVYNFMMSNDKVAKLLHNKTELEKFLRILNENKSKDGKNLMSEHFLNIYEEEIPKRYQPILRRLLEAFANAKVRETMEAEDDVLVELQEKEAIIQKQNEIIQEKDEVIKNAIKQMLAMNMSIENIAKTFGKSIEFVKKFQ